MAAPDPAISLDAVSATVAVQAANGFVSAVANANSRAIEGHNFMAEYLRFDAVDSKKRVDYAQAVGIRHVEESGSGMARYLGSLLSPPQPTTTKTS